MNLADLALGDLIGVIVGFFLTLLVFSYLLGDNPLFRLSIYLFIGVAAGYAAIVTIYSVILPRLFVPLISGSRGEQILALLPLLLSVMLLTKISPRLARVGNISMAFLVGVGAATAIGGAVVGTLFPQINAAINAFDWQILQAGDANLWLQIFNGVILLFGTIATLAYFHFGGIARPGGAPRSQLLLDQVRPFGLVFIAVTFGFLFAGVYAASLTALIERLSFLVEFVRPLLASFL